MERDATRRNATHRHATRSARALLLTLVVSLAGMTLAATTACRNSSEGQQDLSPWHGPSITDLNAINARDTGQWHVLHTDLRDGVLTMRARADNPSQAAHIAAKLVQANKNMGYRDIHIQVLGPDAAENAAPLAQASLLGDAAQPAPSEPERH